jgi:hypothetical protein
MLVLSVLLPELISEPTKKAKGRILRKRETLSLPRFDRSCIRNALLEMVNSALKLLQGGVLMLVGFLSWQKALSFMKWILVGWLSGSSAQKCWDRFGCRPL